MCPAPLGNSFWKARTKQCRHKLFTSPDILWAAAVEYFEWVDANPLIEHKVTQFQGNPVEMQEPKMRAMTINGFCLFLGINISTYKNYKANDNYKDYFSVMETIDETIRDQKFSGAAAGLLNTNIIARDLGLKESTTNEHTGSVGVELTRFVVKPE